MSNIKFLGNPPLSVKHWLRDRWLPAGAWTEVVKALEKGNIKDGKLNGIKFSGKSIEIGASLATPFTYYQGDDGEIIADSEWIVCGFNGAVPEYVKYLTDLDRFFVKAVDDNYIERPVAEGDLVYVRGWDDSAHDYVYSKVGEVAGMEGEFKYGDTNTDYGTISIKDPYAVPVKLTVHLDDGRTKVAEFAGHNMQLWSRYQHLDCDLAGSFEAAQQMMKDPTQCSTFCFPPSSWRDTALRLYMNDVKQTIIPCHYYPHGSGYAFDGSYTNTTHSFLQKVLAANSSAFLENVCAQANRVWYGDSILHTVDRFWLPDCGLLRSAPYNNTTSPYTRTLAENYKDCETGLCEEKGFKDCMYKIFINGSFGGGCMGNHYLRSKHAQLSYKVAAVNYQWTGHAIFDQNEYGWCRETGFAPACTIG